MRNSFAIPRFMRRRNHSKALDATWRNDSAPKPADYSNGLTFDEALELIRRKNKTIATRNRHAEEAGYSGPRLTPKALRTQQAFRDANATIKARVKMPVFSIQQHEIDA